MNQTISTGTPLHTLPNRYSVVTVSEQISQSRHVPRGPSRSSQFTMLPPLEDDSHQTQRNAFRKRLYKNTSSSNSQEQRNMQASQQICHPSSYENSNLVCGGYCSNTGRILPDISSVNRKFSALPFQRQKTLQQFREPAALTSEHSGLCHAQIPKKCQLQNSSNISQTARPNRHTFHTLEETIIPIGEARTHLKVLNVSNTNTETKLGPHKQIIEDTSCLILTQPEYVKFPTVRSRGSGVQLVAVKFSNTNVTYDAQSRESHHLQQEQYRDYRMAKHTGISLQMAENVEEVETDRINIEEYFPKEVRMASHQRSERPKSVEKPTGETHRFIVTVADGKVTNIVPLSEDAERTNTSDTNSAIRNLFENTNTDHLVQCSRKISRPRRTVVPTLEDDFKSDDYQEETQTKTLLQVPTGRRRAISGPPSTTISDLAQSSRQISSPEITVVPTMEDHFKASDYQEETQTKTLLQVPAGRRRAVSDPPSLIVNDSGSDQFRDTVVSPSTPTRRQAVCSSTDAFEEERRFMRTLRKRF